MKILKSLKNILLIFILASFIVMLSTSQSSAALQANPNTRNIKKDEGLNWIRNIRYMEAQNGAMGLNERLNGDYSSVESNNIDVHMMRTTEYGAIAILSASAYGNPSNQQYITSTTGNNTGVIVKVDEGSIGEATAGGYGAFAGINNKYYDWYNYNPDYESARVGDALGKASSPNPGCYRWHSATVANWMRINYGADYYHFIRGYRGLFGYTYEKQQWINDSQEHWCRGVAVCGQGM